jgi:hypothetical protein
MHAALVCLALLIVSACDEHPVNPARPTDTQRPPPPPTRIWTDLGEYTVTMSAAASCSLPAYAMTHTYYGRLKESDQDLVATFDDTRFVAWAGPSGVAGTRAEETVRFTMNGDYFVDGYSFVYLIDGGTELAYAGTATGECGDSSIVATLAGTVLLRRYSDHILIAQCDATDHRVELIRK